ncbi:unnamed protein product [Spirodela intermedia]|uniref:glucan endo-1,3-beta-D-glucosidase n=1 Tax=Spirodela intermedia TaxID=51605 RepID=A0A7I8IT04_SPIIN|nr:unnamed protein product [Spirodela intermedia]CAA6660660.1 unnamed protein product [Spirodela intermedia]
MDIKRVKLYDADPNVLRAFQNSNVEFIVAIDNGKVASVMDPTKARAWIEENVKPYLPQTLITSITVGNEVFSGSDTSVYQALKELGLDKQVNVTTAHSFAILSSSFPPSSGTFRPDLAEYLQPLLNFHAEIKSPFFINSYPFFAYKADPSGISLDYALFRPNSGVRDPNTNFSYDNMLYAQIDSVYSAVKAMGHSDIDIRISETGWPSKGDSDEFGASLENAATYNRNLLKRISMGQGTPMKPSVPIDVFVFALFNENMKPGPSSERNYGLLYPDGTPVYDLGLQQDYQPTYFASSSTSRTTVRRISNVFPLVFSQGDLDFTCRASFFPLRRRQLPSFSRCS